VRLFAGEIELKPREVYDAFDARKVVLEGSGARHGATRPQECGLYEPNNL
jgi:hypothetical protein